jgi:hypothetical protein
LNQNNAVILTDPQGLLLIRGFHIAALRDTNQQTCIREIRAFITAFGLKAHDIFPPEDEAAGPALTTESNRVH